MRTSTAIAPLLTGLLLLACNGRDDTYIPLSTAEKIPSFFYLKEHGHDYLETSSKVQRYYNTILEYFGRTDTIAAEFYRVEEFDRSCIGLSYGSPEGVEKYCVPRILGAHVLLFANGNVAMYFIDVLVNQADSL